ncbi:hypothetical protein LO771_17225 [Streptacidiphilus sp. ASG 303]|uniref:COG4315 family predicted lipoprotein n=1 Tax=Streptacidiphilus sp. ASG 303 TaxID=2896847 RepID=UPI001E2B740A|nr:hypothetical protein [Streptacidiphilus sp. ASG 303]MCD0484087.1 hypothetical protein [Streptacidiphilus sp. ASG 303]
MFRTYAMPLAVLVTVGTAALSACSSTATPAAPAAPAASAAAPAPAAPAPAVVGGAQDGAAALLQGSAQSNSAPAGTGDWALPGGGVATGAALQKARNWVQLTAGSAGVLDPVVVNGAGLTLYRFDKDTANPSRSNCNDACAVTWPPVTVRPGGRVFLDGVDGSRVGVVRRADGALQVTVGGWPVYRFAKDGRPGDTFGQGVGGTWFGVTPDGGRAGGGTGGTGGTGGPGAAGQAATGQGTPAQGTSAQGGGDAGQSAPATSATLFDDPRFSDSGPSQGVTGQGCANLTRPGVASSLSASGTLKLWSQPDCTGRSVVVSGDVADLSSVGFDNAAASVGLG